MGLLDKEVCAFCGKSKNWIFMETMKGGHLCGECKKGKFSPFFQFSEHTVEEAQKYLADRFSNKPFQPTKAFFDEDGYKNAILIDETHRLFRLKNRSGKDEYALEIYSLDEIKKASFFVVLHEHEHVKFNALAVDTYEEYTNSQEMCIRIELTNPYISKVEIGVPKKEPEDEDEQEFQDLLNLKLQPVIDYLNQFASAPAEDTDDENTWKCPVCEQKVNDSMSCPNCGALNPNGDPIYQCNTCGWSPEDPHDPPRVCPHCGDAFNLRDTINVLAHNDKIRKAINMQKKR